MKEGRARKLSSHYAQQELDQSDCCLRVVRRLDKLLQEAYETVDVEKFQSMLVYATRELYDNVCERWSVGDGCSLSSLVQTMESWVEQYNAGGQPLILMLLGRVQLATMESPSMVQELLRQARCIATDVLSRRYLLSRILELEGNIFFEVDVNRASEAYLECLEVCQSQSVKQRNGTILEQLKLCMVQCHYRLSILERIQQKHEGMLEHLLVAKRSVVDLFGRESILAKRMELTYNQELEWARRCKSQSKPKPPPPVKQLIEVYNGQILTTENNASYTCDLNIAYCVSELILNISIKSQRQGKRSTIELSYPIEVPQDKLKTLGDDLSWLSIFDNKIVVSEKQLTKIIAGEPKTSRRSFWVVEKKHIFTESSKNPDIEGILGASSEEEEQEEEDESEANQDSFVQNTPQGRPVRRLQLPVKGGNSRLSHQTTFL